MHAPLAHQQFARISSLRAEKDRRRQRKLQARRGGLVAFVRYFWHILEPATKLVGGWPLEAICAHLEAVTFGEINRLLINVPPGFMKSLLVNVFWPAWEWGPMNMPHHRYVSFSYSPRLTERDNGRFRTLLESESYQSLWGERFALEKIGDLKVSNYKTGWKLATSIGGLGTGERGSRVMLDDPHNVKEIESDTVREETVRWFRESMSNRLNNPKTSAIVVIMQRLHENDVSGAILGGDFDYCHLMIPMEFSPAPYPVAGGEVVYEGNELGWIDPRALDDDGELLSPAELSEREGVLAWEARFDAADVETFRVELGPYAYCTPAESPVLMADLSMKPIGHVQMGDRIAGFVIPKEGGRGRRAHFKEATVLSISESVQPVFKLTFSSGATARCTADHKWFTGRNDKSHPSYAQARVYGPTRKGISNGAPASTGVLCRVCPPILHELSGLRDAGWLGGFFDGEGSAAVMRKRGKQSGVLLTFSQGDGRNLPLCERLESVLRKFDIGFNYASRDRSDRTSTIPANHKQRYYWLKNSHKKQSRLELYQRFLHIAQPIKWRDRIASTILNGRMMTEEERVLSIEPDGIETVYGLETTTGNYVVWGLASSNSGQYDQSPISRKGGIFAAEWWQLWEPEDGKFPTMDFILAALDSAFTEKEENDPSGFTIWGIWQDEAEEREDLARRLSRPSSIDRDELPTRLPGVKVMLMHAWRRHLKIHGPDMPKHSNETYAAWVQRTRKHWGLVEWVAESCRRFKVDMLLIEAKASGLDVIHEMRRLYGGEQWGVEAAEAPRDKVSRALAVQPVFSQEIVYAPARDWAEMVKNEMAAFPKGRYKDLTDSATHALRWLRTKGLIQRPEEIARLVRARAQYRKKPAPLYVA